MSYYREAFAIQAFRQGLVDEGPVALAGPFGFALEIFERGIVEFDCDENCATVGDRGSTLPREKLYLFSIEFALLGSDVQTKRGRTSSAPFVRPTNRGWGAVT